MHSHTSPLDGDAALPSLQHDRTLPSSTVPNGMPISAAMLTDPKSLKKHLSNGIPQPLDFPITSSTILARASSESRISFVEPTAPDLTSISSKDDAHFKFDHKGFSKDTAKIAGVLQSPVSRFDPRQLLDPKGFNPAQVKKDSVHQSDQISSNRLHKRNLENDQGQGMGNLIERMHNVTQREDLPRKKQRSDHVQDEDQGQKKAAFGGGGKGGEIGEYMKGKRKEGQKAAGPNAVVDLTGGE